jgi:DNA repair protein RadC
LLSKGGIIGTIADVRLILSVALKTLATGLILAHNHPSGNLKPSEADKQITIKIRQAAKLLDIELLDHIIISSEGYCSFMDEGILF